MYDNLLNSKTEWGGNRIPRQKTTIQDEVWNSSRDPRNGAQGGDQTCTNRGQKREGDGQIRGPKKEQILMIFMINLHREERDKDLRTKRKERENAKRLKLDKLFGPTPDRGKGNLRILEAMTKLPILIKQAHSE